MMNSYTHIVLLLTILLWSTDGLAQTKQVKVTDCRVGTIEVQTSNGVVRVFTGGRVLDLFTRRVNADDLMRIVSAGFTATGEQKFECDDERLIAAVHLLAQVKDARVLEPLLLMSESSCPRSCDSAVFGMQKLGDRRALPRLLEILRQGGACNWAVVSAVAKVGDETAIADLINTIPAGGSMDAEARLKAIEEITGLSLNKIRGKWGLLYYDNLQQFHSAMHDWWAAHKHQAKIKR